MASLLHTALVLLLVQLASAQPSLSFPLNAQLPPVARVDEFFTYSFSSHTFNSGSDITYTLGNHPEWLSIESSKRRLYGTPDDTTVSAGDVVGQRVDIIATDESGSTSMNATLVVSRNQPPSIKIPLEEQIQTFGNFSAPSSILSYPSTNFKYSFDSDTFGVGEAINYYAVSGDNSPLPAWIKFDGDSLTFTGQTPSFEALVQPPQTFNFNFVASDIVGFSAASIPFSIVVGRHKLATDEPIINLNATRGSKFSYDGLANGIQVDGKIADPGSLNVAIDDMPDWLSFDNETRQLQGTPGKEAHATNFTIHVHDPFSDTLDILAVVNVATGLFEATFEDMTVRPGGQFNLDLSSHFRNPPDINVKVTTSPNEDWLKVDGFKLSGNVPKSAKGNLKISIDAVSKSSGMEETETIGVTFLAPDGTTTTSTSPSSSATSQTIDPSITETGTATADAAASPPGRLSTGEILLATVIPVLFVAVLIMFLVCFFRRRRVRQTYLTSAYRSKISHPVPDSLRINGSEASSMFSGTMTEVTRTEAHMFKPGKTTYTEISSQKLSQKSSQNSSLRPRSSETLNHSLGPDMQRSFMAGGNGTETIRTVSSRGSQPGMEDNRQSWVTVEGDAATQATPARTEKSIRHLSDTTIPESTHQLIPTTSFFSESDDDPFRSAFDLTVPSLEELSNLQPTPDAVYVPPEQAQPRKGVGALYSTAITSSTALPPNDTKQAFNIAPLRMNPSQATMERTAGESRNWLTIEESEAAESVSELRKPELARLSSQPHWYEAASANGSKLFGTESSFGSTENWRIIGKPSVTSGTYNDIAEEASLHSSRAREGALPGERDSSDHAVSSSKWDAKLGPSISLVSRMSDFGNATSGDKDAWRRDDSGKVSEGSFKVFI